MPYYKDLFDDTVELPQVGTKSVFDNTYESTLKPKEIEYQALGFEHRPPTDINILFGGTGIENLQKKHPNLYGVIGSGIESAREVGDWVVDIVPALKYGRPEDRTRFVSLDTTDQRMAIMQETLGALLWSAAGRPLEFLGLFPKAAKGIFKTGSATTKTLRSGATPILDKGFSGWKSTNTRHTFMRWAKKKGYPQARATQAYEFGTGESTAVHASAKDIWSIYNLENEIQVLNAKNFGATVSKTSQSMRGAFKGWAAKKFGKANKGMTLDTASEPTLKEFNKWFCSEAPGIHQTAARATQINERLGEHLYGFVNLYPIRFVLGAGEKTYRTFSQVYRKIESATKLKNKGLADNISRFYEILEEGGLMTKTKRGRFKPIPQLTGRVKNLAYAAITKADDIHEAVRQGAMTVEAGTSAINQLTANISKSELPIVRRLMDAHYEYFDHLYAQHTKWKMRNIFDEAGVTATGTDSLDIIFKESIDPNIKRMFASGNGLTPTDKVLGVQELLGHLKNEAMSMPGMFRTQEGMRQAMALLEYKAEGGVMDYLGGYATRLVKKDFQMQDISLNLMASMKDPFYTQPRSATQAIGRAETFDSMIYLRTNAQAKEMYYNKSLREVAAFTKDLPNDYKSYISHWIARLHGIPSQVDHSLARVFNNVLPGKWDARRIFNMTKTVNDFTYMGILGLKPFSAMRNLFQPAITLTPTLGKGFFKGWEHMLKGYSKLRDPEMIGYLNSIGVITDYAPELMRMSNVFKIPRSVKIGGKTLTMPTIDAVRDTTMWMFSGSDRLNRYVSGSAAVLQWDAGMTAARKAAGELTGKNVGAFMKATGADKRGAWIQSEVRDLLSRGSIDRAKASFVTDVVAGSQWLYGPLDAPIITQTFGSVGRQMAVFQSWWVHYGANIEQWARTGRGPGGAPERMLSWAMSSAVVATAMSGVWGTGTAKRSTFFGPIISAGSKMGDPYSAVLMVPAWRPVIQAAELAIKAGQLIGGASEKELSAVKRQSKALLQTSFNFIPAGNITYNVGRKLLMKSQPGVIPTRWEMKAGVKELAGIRSF